MSKEVNRKPVVPENRNGSEPTAVKPAMSGKVAVTPARPSRVSQPVAVMPAARGIRPLDIGLVALGLLCTGVIVWLLLSNSQTGSSGSAATVPTLAGGMVGQKAADFTLPATDGQTYTLSQFKGKPVLLEFMAPWCPHCQKDSVLLNQIYAANKDKGLQMLSISATPLGRDEQSPIAMEDLTWFRDTFKVPFPILFDKDATIGHSKYDVQGFPTIYTLNPQGVIVAAPAATVKDPLTVEMLQAAVDAALGTK